VTSEAAEAAALEANESFYRAFNQKDVEAMDAVWSARDDLNCVHPGWNVLRGREPVLESWHGILNNPNQPRIVIGGAVVSIVGEVAIVVCRELVGGSPLAATNVFVLEGGDWKLLHHQSGPVASIS
jgi:ketosteroid isomerase-like protein